MAKSLVAYLSLGSNLGDRLENLQRATNLLSTQDIKVDAVSSVYESAALIKPGSDPQPAYLNAVVKILTILNPFALLIRCGRIEWLLGRRSEPGSWRPRIIDIDVLLYEGVTVSSDVLTLPHPEMGTRSFVQEPLREFLGDVEARAVFFAPAPSDFIQPACWRINELIKLPNFRSGK